MLSVWLAFYLRLGEFYSLAGQPLSLVFSPVLIAALVSVLLAIPIFVTSGLYRAIFRYSGLPAMMAMARAMLSSPTYRGATIRDSTAIERG